MKGVVVETSCWPVVWIMFGGDATDEQLKQALDTLSTLVERPSPHVLVFDVRKSALTRPHHIAMQTSWIKEQLPQFRKHVAGVCFLLESPVVSFALASVIAMNNSPINVGVASTAAEAARWSTGQLMKRGFRAPDITDLTG